MYKVLEGLGLTVWIVNARHIKYVSGNKSDKKDSARICKLILAGLLNLSYMPLKDRRELIDELSKRIKTLLAHYENVVECFLSVCLEL